MKFWQCLFLLFLLYGCSDSIVYDHSVPIVDGIWTYNNYVPFEFEIEDTSSLYRLNLEVNHSTDYTFQNLYVKFRTSYPSDSVREDIVSLELADENGLWNGTCRGGNCSVSIPLQEKTFFQSQGKYGIQLEQYMRQDSLEGIYSISLSLEKIIE